MASSAPAAPSNLLEEGTAEADATQATARLEADVEALLRLGVPVAKLEELYGTSLVCSIAKAMVKSSEGEATGKLPSASNSCSVASHLRGTRWKTRGLLTPC